MYSERPGKQNIPIHLYQFVCLFYHLIRDAGFHVKGTRS